MVKLKDLTGKRFDKLTVIKFSHSDNGAFWICRCVCGGERVVNTSVLNRQKSIDCGCSRHGHSRSGFKSREVICYDNMISRCHNKNNKRYRDYGGNGLFVCERWRESFVNFLKDMGQCPPEFQIERIDNTRGYFKENCKWASRSENMKNRKNCKWWVVDNLIFGSAREAGSHFGVHTSTIVAWCEGRHVGDTFYQPKQRCFSLNKY